MNLNKLELTTLYEISKILASSLNLKTTLKSVMKILSDFLDMKRGTVVLKKDNKLSTRLYNKIERYNKQNTSFKKRDVR